MTQKISIAFSFMVIVIYLASESRARSTGEYNYMKLSVRWPKSFCNSRRDMRCHWPTLQNFTIHGFWPMYWYNNEDTPVDAFNYSECTQIEPTPESSIKLSLFGTSLADMIKYWPDVAYYRNNTSNEVLWKYQWRRHGMCSKYPREPLRYFKAALDYIKGHNFLKFLYREAIFPDNQKYYVADIVYAIESILGARPQIRCNKDIDGNVQLSEIWICFFRSGNYMRCKYPSSNCGRPYNLRPVKFSAP